MKRNVEELEERIRSLEASRKREKHEERTSPSVSTSPSPIKTQEKSIPVSSSTVPKEEKKEEIVSAKTESKPPVAAKTVNAETKVKKETSSVSKNEPVPVLASAPQEPGYLTLLWKKIEKPLSENWTGILGAVILVAGISFLGIYALFILSAAYRCLLILGFAGTLCVLSLWTGRKSEFRNLSLALRSSAAAVFLFVCLGAGFVDVLKFLENPYSALGVLTLGIVANLFAGYRSKNETFASLHTILGLVAVCIPQSSAYTLVVLALICLPGVIWNYREKRQIHLLVVSTGFFAAHLYWNSRFFSEAKPQGTEIILPILCILPVFGGALLVHYRETLYRVKEFEGFPLASHLLNWAYLGISLVRYSQNSKLSTFVLFVSAAIVWFLSSLAKRKQIPWLFLTDRLVSQSLIILGVFSLHLWELGNLSIVAILALEILIFSFVCFREQSRFLERISLSLTAVVFGILVFFSYKEFFQSADPGVAIPESLTTQAGYGILIITLVAFIGILERKFPEAREELSLTSLLLTVMSLLAGGGLFSLYLNFSAENYGIWIPSIVLSALLILREKLSSKRLLITAAILALLTTLSLWKTILFSGRQEPEKILALCLPWLLPFLVYLKNCNISSESGKTKPKYWPGAFGFTAHFVFTFYHYLDTKSSLLFGPFAILLSLTYLELGRRFRSRENLNSEPDREKFSSSLFSLSFVLVVLFLLRHFTVEFQSSVLLVGIPARFWIEILSGSVFLYWVLFPEEEFSALEWLRSAQPLFWELILSIFIIGIYTEVPERIVSFAMSLTVFLVFFLSRIESLKTERFVLYSYFFFIWTNLEIFLGGETAVFASKSEFPWSARGFQIASIFVQLGAVFYVFPKAGLDGLEVYFRGWTRFWKIPLRFFQKYRNLLPGYLGVFGVVASVYVYSKDILSPVSNLIVGPAWALLSILFLEAGSRFGRRAKSSAAEILADFLKRASWLGLIAFSIHYVYVDLQSSYFYLWILPASGWTALLGIFVWLYWAGSEIREAETVPFWKIVYPLLNEGCLLFLGLVAYSVIGESWISVTFALAALLVLEIGIRKSSSLSRFRWYGILFHLVSCFYLTFVVSTEDNPIVHWTQAKWIPGVLTILLLFLFVYRAYRGYGREDISFPTGLGFLKGISDRTGTHLNSVVYYPFFIGIFLFLYWSFSSAVLTLLWATLAFLIFLLGLFLKESWFRYLSLGVLLFCVGRLVFYDLSSSGTILKAVVFLGVGSILLLMNTIYNKYRDRF